MRRLVAEPSGRVLVRYNFRFATGAGTAESRLVRRDGTPVGAAGDGGLLVAPDGRELRRTPRDLTRRAGGP